MWWQDFLWGVWNGLTAWVILIAVFSASGNGSRSITKREAATGMTSASCWVQVRRSSGCSGAAVVTGSKTSSARGSKLLAPGTRAHWGVHRGSAGIQCVARHKERAGVSSSG